MIFLLCMAEVEESEMVIITHTYYNVFVDF